MKLFLMSFFILVSSVAFASETTFKVEIPDDAKYAYISVEDFKVTGCSNYGFLSADDTVPSNSNTFILQATDNEQVCSFEEERTVTLWTGVKLTKQLSGEEKLTVIFDSAIVNNINIDFN